MSATYQLFPALDPAVEAALRESISRFGVLVPVAKDQHGNMLDGHHRRRIADELGVKYRVDVVNVADEDEAREIALTLNTDRRQMDPGQRLEVEVALREAGHSFRAIGEVVGVSEAQVHHDLAGVKDLTPPDRVHGKDGKSYPARKPTVIPAKNEREAERAQSSLAGMGDALPDGRVIDLKRLERMEREHAAEQRRQEPTEAASSQGVVEIRHGDFRTALDDISFGTVDAIVTDPPYEARYWRDAWKDGLYYDLGRLAANVLTPSGVLAVMIGTRLEMLDAVDVLLGRSMRRRWRGVYLVPGPRWRDQLERVATGYKPILIYSHPDAPDDLPWINDDVFGSAGDDKEHHHWGQSESGMASIVERLTTPGQLVVDPFLGGGTTAVVCRDLGRRFIGCDSDAAAVQTSRERLCG